MDALGWGNRAVGGGGYARSTGSHSSQRRRAEVGGAVEHRHDRGSGPQPPRVGGEPVGGGRGPRGLQGRRVRARGAEHRPGAGRNLDRVEVLGHRRRFGDGDAVEVGQLAALGVVGVDVGTHLEQPRRLGVAQSLEADVLGFGQRSDVRLDVRIGAVVDERHAGRMADESEGRSICDAGVHRGVPFYGQAEPELRLCAKGATVSAHVTGADAVHRPERSAERLSGAVAVPHGDSQQVTVSEDVGRGDGHAASPDVLGQRHAGQRREHPAEVVLRRAETGSPSR